MLLLVLTLGFWSGAARAMADLNPSDFQFKMATPHFILYYNTTGAEAVTADQAKAASDAMELSYDRLVTKGHLRTPYGLPAAVALGVDDVDLGGFDSREDLYFRQWIYINANAGDWSSLHDVTAHELFHLIQNNYLLNPPPKSDDWVIEGTASAVSYLAYRDDPLVVQNLLKGAMGMYWRSHETNFKAQSYPTSLFWYDLANRYGGLPFLGRFFELGGQFGWERGLQYAVLEKGGPDNTTFDTLFRDFMLRMLSNDMGLSYPAGYGRLWPDGVLGFDGHPQTASYGWVTGGLTMAGTAYAYYPPLQVDPWAFHVIPLSVHGQGAGVPVRVRLSGDPELELYALVPQPDGSRKGLRAARPAEGLVLPPLSGRDAVTLVVARMGTSGSGRYALSLDAPTGVAPGTLQPLTALTADPPSGPHDGTPPALTPSQLADLRAGRLLPPLVTLTEAPVVLLFCAGQTTYVTRTGVKTLPAAPAVVQGAFMLPVSVATDLGATVQASGTQALVTYQGRTFTASAGNPMVSRSDGLQLRLDVAPMTRSGTLLVPEEFWLLWGFEMQADRNEDGTPVLILASPPPPGQPATDVPAR